MNYEDIKAEIYQLGLMIWNDEYRIKYSYYLEGMLKQAMADKKITSEEADDLRKYYEEYAEILHSQVEAVKAK